MIRIRAPYRLGVKCNEDDFEYRYVYFTISIIELRYVPKVIQYSQQNSYAWCNDDEDMFAKTGDVTGGFETRWNSGTMNNWVEGYGGG